MHDSSFLQPCCACFAQARTTTDRTNDLKPVWNEYIRLDVDSPILDVEVSIRDSGPKFMRRRLSSVSDIVQTILVVATSSFDAPCTHPYQGGAGDYSKKQVNRMLHPEVARGVIAAATIRRGVATPFVRIDLQSVGGKDEGEHAGTITLRSQVQYPESLVLPSTAFSVRMLEKFSQDRTPRLVLISVDRVRHLKALDTPSMFGKPLGHSFIIKMKVQG